MSAMEGFSGFDTQRNCLQHSICKKTFYCQLDIWDGYEITSKKVMLCVWYSFYALHLSFGRENFYIQCLKKSYKRHCLYIHTFQSHYIITSPTQYRLTPLLLFLLLFCLSFQLYILFAVNMYVWGSGHCGVWFSISYMTSTVVHFLYVSQAPACTLTISCLCLQTECVINQTNDQFSVESYEAISEAESQHLKRGHLFVDMWAYLMRTWAGHIPLYWY